MAGSRKGERRGGAKPKMVKRGFGTGAGRAKGSKNKPKPLPFLDREFLAILTKRHGTIASREREAEMYLTITGKGHLLPKDMLWAASKYWEETASEYIEVLRSNLRAAAEAKSPETQALIAAAIKDSENEVNKYMSLAADAAFKAGRFFHPTFAALMTNPGGDKSAGTLLELLMRDLDEAGKPARYIDHDVGEVVK